MAGIDLIAEAGFVELPNEPAVKKVGSQAIHGEIYPELGVPNSGANIPDTKINQWIEESLVYTAQRESFEKDNPLVLTLFRYLGIRHRVLFPQGQSHSYKLDPQLMVKLRKAICDKAVEYFILSVNQDGLDKLQKYPILSSHAEQPVQDSQPVLSLAKPHIRHSYGFSCFNLSHQQLATPTKFSTKQVRQSAGSVKSGPAQRPTVKKPLSSAAKRPTQR